MAERALAYDLQFDISNSVKVRNNPQKESQFKLRTKHNLKTALGERFNVELSRVNYQIKNGHLTNPDHDEPFVEIIKRGVEYRLMFANPCDRQRERAELAGFEKVEKLLTTNDGPLTTNVIVISPAGNPGSIYQHNFFDIYQKRGLAVTMTRYPSKTTLEDFWQAACELDPTLPTPIELSDAYFLSHPIQTTKTKGEIIALLQKDQSAMLKENFDKLIADCSPLIAAYINGLAQDSEDQTKKTFNALLNYADSINSIRGFRGLTPNSLGGKQAPIRVEEVIKVYGAMQARTVTTGCGLQSGFSTMNYEPSTINSFAPFSVSEFANKCPDCGGTDNHFHCPGCHGQIESGRGITTCPHCHLTKEQTGSKC